MHFPWVTHLSPQVAEINVNNNVTLTLTWTLRYRYYPIVSVVLQNIFVFKIPFGDLY